MHSYLILFVVNFDIDIATDPRLIAFYFRERHDRTQDYTTTVLLTILSMHTYAYYFDFYVYLVFDYG